MFLNCLNCEKDKMNKSVPYHTLSDGNRMPAIGLGTMAANGNEVENAIKMAIDAGYRHIDTAWAYGNEAAIGKAVRAKIAQGTIKRSDIFIVTKLWNTFHESDKVEAACQLSLNNLGLGYIDLYLIHFPFGYVYKNDHEQWPRNPDGSRALSNVDYLETWQAMEKLVGQGLVKSIGISNFNSQQIDRILSIARIKPVVNQVECSPTINQKKLIKFCKQRDIIVTGFSPLGHPGPYSTSFIRDERVIGIARKYNKTPAQIGLRYLIENGVVPIPKSSNKNRIEENIDVFDFVLDENDHNIMNSFHTGDRLVAMHDAKKSPHYPYGLKF